MNSDLTSRNGVFNWLLGSVGVTGILLLVGFVIDVAYQEFFGYRIREVAAPDYYIANAGEFLLNSTLLLLEAAFDRWWISVSLLVVGAWLSWHGPNFPLANRTRIWILVLGVVLGGVQLFYFVVPALSVRDLLVKNVGVIAPAAELPLLSRQTHRLYTAQVCPRITRYHYAEAKKRSIDCSAERNYATIRRDYFVLNLLLLMGAALILVYIPVIRETRLPTTWVDRVDPDVTFQRSLTVTIAILLCVGVVGLLTVYPRTVRDTNLNEVVVYFKPRGLPRATGVDSLQSAGASFKPDTISEGFLLSRSKDAVSLYIKADRKIWIVTPSQIEYLQVLGMNDVLKDYFQANLAPALADR